MELPQTLTVVRHRDGFFVVGKDGVPLDGPFSTNSEAWRRVDRLVDEPTSPREKAADWMWDQWAKR